jgi:hypothetical protein
MKKFCFLFLLGFTCLSLLLPCFAQADSQDVPQVNVRILLESSDAFDGKTVKISGQLIGQALYQKHGVWFHLLDEEGLAIGIWAQKEDLAPFSYFGKYGVTGDHISLKGIFHKACQLHGGDTDIHLVEIDEIQEGYLLEAENISSSRWYLLLVLLLVLSGLLVYISRVAVNKTESQ